MKPAPLLLVAGLLAAASLTAQTSTDSMSQMSDPPSRVARLSWLAGDVAFQPAGLEDWTDATLNYPLSTSDHLVTGKDSRAEIHIGPNAIRLDSGSNFGFLNLDDSIVQVSLTEGSMEIRLRLLGDSDSFEVATPNGAITLLRTGDYRIDTDPDRDATMLTVRSGQAELFSSNNNSMIIEAQETAYFRENQDPDVRSANEADDFDAFASTRDGNADAPAAASHVSPEVTGAEDLNAYGSWQNLPVYGDVWVPPVDADWAPYSDGEWTYVDSWGWTWIDAAPWGFAPFHYGRWTYARNRWVWAPDARTVPVIYAPALVTFYGGGASGSVSWSPLAVTGRFAVANRNAPGAVHSMSQIDFIGGTHVRPAVAIAAEGQLLGSSPLLAPVRDSVLAGKIRPGPPVANRPLVARTAPPPAPLLLNFKQGLLAQNKGRPLTAKQLEDLRHQAPYATVQRQNVRYTKPLVNTPRSAKAVVAAKQATQSAFERLPAKSR